MQVLLHERESLTDVLLLLVVVNTEPKPLNPCRNLQKQPGVLCEGGALTSLEGARQLFLKACAHFQRNKAVCSDSVCCFSRDSGYSSSCFPGTWTHILPGLLNKVFRQLWVSCVCPFVSLSFVSDLTGLQDEFLLEVRFPWSSVGKLRLPVVSACLWGGKWHFQPGSAPGSESRDQYSNRYPKNMTVPVPSHLISSSNTDLKAHMCPLLLRLNWKQTIKFPKQFRALPHLPNPTRGWVVSPQSAAAVAEGLHAAFP